MHEYKHPFQELHITEPAVATKIQAAFLGELQTDPEASLIDSTEHVITPEMRAELQRQALEFKTFLQSHEKIVIAHHIDADGLMSTVLLLHALSEELNIGLKELFYEKVELLSVNNGLRNFDDAQMEKLAQARTKGYSGILFADLSPRDAEQLAELQAMGFKIGNVDHHRLKADTPELDMRFNPASIPNMPSQIIDELSTSVLILPTLTNEKELRWLATLGNIGDEGFSMTTDLDPELQGAYNDLARKLNIIGATEKYGVSPLERDAFIQKILEAFLFTFEATLSEGLLAAKGLIDTAPLFKERFDSIGSAIMETQLFLLETVNLVAQNKKERDTTDVPELLTISSEEGQRAIVLEGNTYRVIVHEVDTDFAEGNVVVGNMIKMHQNALKWLSANGKSHNKKPTTVILAQKRDAKTTEYGVYTIDDRVKNSETISCDSLMQWLKENYPAGGGGHRDRAGGDIPHEFFSEATWKLLEKVMLFFESTQGDNIPDELKEIQGTDFISSIFRPDTIKKETQMVSQEI